MERRKMRAERHKGSVWSGLGSFGMIGWSVAVPTVAGAAIGIWMDKAYPQHFSWTLTLLITGLMLGCVIAWNWIEKEKKAMRKDEDDNDNK